MVEGATSREILNNAANYFSNERTIAVCDRSSGSMATGDSASSPQIAVGSAATARK